MNDKREIIFLAVTGRSGASLMASYLKHCGIPMADQVLEPGKWNRKRIYVDQKSRVSQKLVITKQK